MSKDAEPIILPDIEEKEKTDLSEEHDRGYLVIAWNDPVNLMVYVTHVFMTIFGWPKPKAEHHMMQVHTQGRRVLKRESMERAEFSVHQLQGYGLHATMEQDEP